MQNKKTLKKIEAPEFPGFPRLRLHRTFSAVLLIVVLAIGIFYVWPAINRSSNEAELTKEIGLHFDGPGSFSLEIPKNSRLTSLKISGKASGKAEPFDIVLIAGEQRYIIASSSELVKGFEKITGFTPGSSDFELIFDKTCLETCRLLLDENVFNIEIRSRHGTAIDIASITYTIK